MLKRLRITINGEPFEVTAEVIDEANLSGAPSSSLAPSAVSAPLLAAAPRPTPAAGGSGVIASPMSGKLVGYAVKVGDMVAVGDELATVEAMKMNTYVHAEAAGKVHELLANPGDGVEEGQGILVVK